MNQPLFTERPVTSPGLVTEKTRQCPPKHKRRGVVTFKQVAWLVVRFKYLAVLIAMVSTSSALFC